MRRGLITLSIVVLALGLAGAAVYAKKASEAPTKVFLNAVDEGGKQPGVHFDHGKHMELAETCAKCHHTQKDLTAGSDVEVKTCAGCHLNPEEEGVPDIKQMSPSKNAYHITCMGCHKESGKDTAPTKCTQCHVKGE